jgi:hypothetical protein
MVMDSEDQEEEGWKEEPTLYAQQYPYVPSIDNLWYNDLKKYLHHNTTYDHFNAKKKRALRMKSAQYQLVHIILFRNNCGRVILCFLEKKDVNRVLKDLHDESVGVIFLRIPQPTRF